MVAVPDQGRRLLSGSAAAWGPWSEEVPEALAYVHRFAFAAGLAAGKRVLDLSPGDGYGSALLAEQAESVLRVEPDAMVVVHGRYNYRRPNLTFVHGKPVDALPGIGGSTDVVVAFGWAGEEAEELAKRAAAEMPAEGLLLLSADAGTAAHLGEALGAHFSEVRTWSQWTGALLLQEGDPDGPAPVSALIACSNAPIEAPARTALDDYRFLRDRLDAVAPMTGHAAQAPGADTEAWDETRLRRQLAAFDVAARTSVAAARDARLEAELARSDLQLSALEVARLQAEVADAEAELSAAQASLAAVTAALGARLPEEQDSPAATARPRSWARRAPRPPDE
jgi:hypothetical protein